MTLSANQAAGEFIESVLRLEPRLAVLDCDGTLWSGNAGDGFFGWELARGVVSDEIVRWAHRRFADYVAGKVDEDTMCGEMVTMHRGLREAEVQQAASEYCDQNLVTQIFPVMRELVRRLQDTGCDVWAVSSTNEWVIRAGMKHVGIDAGKILAASAVIENGRITDRLIRVPTGEGKPRAILDVIRRVPDAAFGNSRWDTEMLAMARYGFAVNPDVYLEKTAQRSGWTVYWPDGTRRV